MKLVRIMVACGLSCVTTGVGAQGLDAPANAAAPQEPAKEARVLTTAELSSELAAMQQNLKMMTTNMDAIIDHVAANKDTPQRLDDLERRMMEYSTAQQDLMKKLDEIQQSLQEIQQPAAGGERITTLRPFIEDQNLRKQLADAVQNEMPKQGLFHVENTTDVDRTIEINRTSFTIPSQQARSFRVAVGTVTTQLPGEPLMTWSVAAPTYDQRIQIVPKAIPTTVSRPITSDSVPTAYPPAYGSEYLYYPW
jgi:hypothetical protein